MKIRDYPQRIVIELSVACNLSCAMCPRRYIKEKDGCMPGGLWKRLIDEIASASPQSIILPFWRGESLVHPDFIGLIGYALSRSARLHMSTNGILAAGDCARALLDCEFVTFSVHNRRGYERAKEFLALRRGKSPVVQISFVKNEKTADEICAALVDSPDLSGFDSIRIYDEHSKDGIFGKTNGDFIRPRQFCSKLEDTLVIAYDGSVSRCNHIWDTDSRINADENSIKKIWDSQMLEDIRREYPDYKCRPCGQWIGHTCGESYQYADGRVRHKIYTTAGVSAD